MALQPLRFDHDDYEDRVDYKVRSAFQNETLSQEDLYRTFLGVLAVDGESFEQRLAEFTIQPDKTDATLEVRD
jgi:hypothetical protein